MKSWRAGLLVLALVAAPACAAEPWREASSAHFTIYAQDSAAGLREFAERLERFDKALRVIVAVPDDPVGDANKVTIYVVANTIEVQKLIGQVGSQIAGFYSGRAGGSIAVTSRQKSSDKLDLQPQIVLLHEYTHHFMLRNFPAAYPAWFREGYAEFYSTTRFEPDGALTIGVVANHRVYDLSAVRDPHIDWMLADADGRQSIGSSELYGWGWLLTHYLTFDTARRGQLTRYLAAINLGTPAAQAATDAFGDPLQLKRELQAYLSRRRMASARIEAARLPIGPVAVRDLGPGTQAILPVAIRSRIGVSQKTARSVAAAAQTAAAPFPADPFVQTALAEALYDHDELDAADAAADRAIAADPKAIRAWLCKAKVRLVRAKGPPPPAKGKDKAAGQDAPTPPLTAAQLALVKEARRFIVRANRLDPDDPRPLILYYASFAASGETPPANAVTGLVTAHLLAREDDGLRLMLASRMIEDNRAVEARTLLAPLAFSPHADTYRDVATAMLKKLDAPPAAAAAH